MNIQKSPLAAVFALAMVVCMIFGMMVVPASAASGMTMNQINNKSNASTVAAAVLASCGVDLQGSSNYGALAAGIGNFSPTIVTSVYYGANGKYYIINSRVMTALGPYNSKYGTAYGLNTNAAHYVDSKGRTYWELPAEYTKTFGTELYGDEFTVSYVPAKNIIAGNIDGSGISGILNQITGLLPVVLTFLVGAIPITKAVSFITGVIRGA